MHWNTLDSGINVAPGITVAPPLKNFHIMILILFYINLGIAVIFDLIFFFKFFQKLISVPLRLFRSLEYKFNSYFIFPSLPLQYIWLHQTLKTI